MGKGTSNTRPLIKMRRSSWDGAGKEQPSVHRTARLPSVMDFPSLMPLSHGAFRCLTRSFGGGGPMEGKSASWEGGRSSGKRPRSGGGGGQARGEIIAVQGVCEALLALSQAAPPREDIVDVPASSLLGVEEEGEQQMEGSAQSTASSTYTSSSPASPVRPYVQEHNHHRQLPPQQEQQQRQQQQQEEEEECDDQDHGAGLSASSSMCDDTTTTTSTTAATSTRSQRVFRPTGMCISVERPVGPANPHAAAFEASSAAIVRLRETGDLDVDATAIMGDGIEFFFAVSREDFAGKDLLRVLKESVPEQRRNTAAVENAGSKSSNSAMWLSRAPGFVWATEVLSSPQAYTLFFCYVDSKFQVTCNDLMSRLFVGAEEIYRACMDLRSTHVHTLANLMAPRFVEPFYHAVYASCFSNTSRERHTVIQLRDRSGNLVRCLATVRTHWHEGTAAMAVRFWPFSSLIEWPSFTEQCWM